MIDAPTPYAKSLYAERVEAQWKNQIQMIEEVLVHRYHFDHSSAITQAIAYVIFNRNSSRLVNYMDKGLLAFGTEVTPMMVKDGIKHCREILDNYEQSAFLQS